MEQYNYTWADFDMDTALLNDQLNKSTYDLLIGVAAGGLPLLVKLKNLRGEDYEIIQCRSYSDRKQGDLVIESLPHKDLGGKIVVVVDDVADNGLTLASVKQKLADLGVKEVKTLTLVYKPHSLIKPDFYIREVPNETWVSFPWER